jgi:hypothetical protein
VELRGKVDDGVSSVGVDGKVLDEVRGIHALLCRRLPRELHRCQLLRHLCRVTGSVSAVCYFHSLAAYGHKLQDLPASNGCPHQEWTSDP